MRRVALLFLIVAALAGAAFPRALNLEVMPVGYVLTTDEVVDTFGRAVVTPGVANVSFGAFRLTDMEASASRRDDPAWLLLSNAPEVLDGTSEPRRRGVLVSADVPAGRIRVLVSHSSQQELSEDYVLRIENNSDEMLADVVLEPRVSAKENVIPGAYAMDARVGGLLASEFLAASRKPLPLGWHPPDGDRHRVVRRGEVSDARLVTAVRGSGMSWLTLTSSTSLHLTVYSVPNGGTLNADDPVLPRTGSQARGLFAQPDQDVTASVDLASGNATRYVFGGAERANPQGLLDGGSWMTGTDTTVPGAPQAQVNRGDFGGITHFQATVKGPADSEFVGAMFLLVNGGRKAAVLPLDGGKPQVLGPWNALVLGKCKVGDTFRYEFTLPPNSWAPVYMVAVPLHHM
jgi:hypothetical protein